MEFAPFAGARWEIVYGCYEGPEARAVDLLYGALRRRLPYVPRAERTPTGSAHVLYVGTRKSNPHLARLIADADVPAGGTLVRVGKEGDFTVALAAGADPAAVYYAACEFVDDYLAEAGRNPSGASPYFVNPLLDGEAPAYAHTSAPAIRERGLWTWGHVIYDYRAFFEAMARLKLNKVTIWNDFAPLNGREAVEYAHGLGIAVHWGYSWSWGEAVDISRAEELERWAERALTVYREQYADLGGDGIYFQLFTETKEQYKNGVSIAEAAVRWANAIGARLLADYPRLRLDFGLHASSVSERLDAIAGVDGRIDIAWEDCGAFPYAYRPYEVAGFAETLAFTGEMARLRGGKGFGAVLKGMPWLDWTQFEHQYGPAPLGASGEAEMAEKLPERARMWREAGSWWLKNGHFCRETVAAIAEITGGRASLEALAEDGLLEKGAWLPVALFAETLWEAHAPWEEIVRRVTRRETTRF